MVSRTDYKSAINRKEKMYLEIRNKLKKAMCENVCYTNVTPRPRGRLREFRVIWVRIIRLDVGTGEERTARIKSARGCKEKRSG